jgi:membrane-associated protease RseP (regulator of RpoE activity)
MTNGRGQPLPEPQKAKPQPIAGGMVASPAGAPRPAARTAGKSRTGLMLGALLIGALAIGGGALGTGMVQLPGFGSPPASSMNSPNAANPGSTMSDTEAMGDISGAHYIGVWMRTLNPANIKALNLDGHRADGVLLMGIWNGSPAEAAGLRTNDIIVAIDDVPMRSYDEVKTKTRMTAIGATYQVMLDRDGALLSIPVRVARCDDVCTLARSQRPP